jgi:hypothetical protein
VWWHLLETGDRLLLERMWPVVDRALDFVCTLQRPDGAVAWSLDVDGTVGSMALLTGCSSILHSLRCGVALAAEVGEDRPEWELAAGRLRAALSRRPEVFTPKHRWAMDWYYPVLCGVITGSDAHQRIESRWEDFVVPQRGVRCVSDRPWITAAETCELALAMVRCGDGERAAELLEWAQHLRGDDAAYWTGANFTDGCIFPPDEQPSWTAAAVVLAADAVSGGVVAELLNATT